jgi:8-oxo-dGTP pyrophosphatase MutT (NUDIX family)
MPRKNAAAESPRLRLRGTLPEQNYGEVKSKIMPNNERFKLIPSVYALFIRDGKILLSRRFQTGFEDGNYGLPAGHADGRETFREALQREVREEVGVEIDMHNADLVLTILPANTIAYIHEAINCYVRGQSYCEFDWGR